MFNQRSKRSETRFINVYIKMIISIYLNHAKYNYIHSFYIYFNIKISPTDLKFD